MSLDWHAALTVVFGGIILCQFGALHEAWKRRDHWFFRAEDLAAERDRWKRRCLKGERDLTVLFDAQPTLRAVEEPIHDAVVIDFCANVTRDEAGRFGPGDAS